MKNTNSIIYKYVNDILEDDPSKSFFNIFSPKDLQIKNYEMLLQEYYNYSPKQILGLDIKEEPGEKIYRIFEEYFNINIIIIEKRNNVLKHLIPECPSPYFWDIKKGCLMLVILKIKKKEYKVLNVGEEQLRDLIQSKLDITSRSEPAVEPQAQYVDFYGKRRMYIDSNNNVINSVGKPLNCIEYSMEPQIHKIIKDMEFDIKSIGSQRHFIMIQPYKRQKKIVVKEAMLSDSEDERF